MLYFKKALIIFTEQFIRLIREIYDSRGWEKVEGDDVDEKLEKYLQKWFVNFVNKHNVDALMILWEEDWWEIFDPEEFVDMIRNTRYYDILRGAGRSSSSEEAMNKIPGIWVWRRKIHEEEEENDKISRLFLTTWYARKPFELVQYDIAGKTFGEFAWSPIFRWGLVGHIERGGELTGKKWRVQKGHKFYVERVDELDNVTLITQQEDWGEKIEVVIPNEMADDYFTTDEPAETERPTAEDIDADLKTFRARITKMSDEEAAKEYDELVRKYGRREVERKIKDILKSRPTPGAGLGR